MTPSVPLEIGSKGGNNGTSFQSGSKSLLGVHSPDEVMTPFGRWCLEDISGLTSRVWDSIPLTSLQSGGGGDIVVCTTCTLCTRRGIRYTTTHHAEEIPH